MFSDAPRLSETRRRPSSRCTGDDVAFAQRRIVLDLDRRQPELILAVAGAAGDHLGAIAKRVRQFGIGFAVLGRGIVDAAAVNDFGSLAGQKLLQEAAWLWPSPAVIGK